MSNFDQYLYDTFSKFDRINPVLFCEMKTLIQPFIESEFQTQLNNTIKNKKLNFFLITETGQILIKRSKTTFGRILVNKNNKVTAF